MSHAERLQQRIDAYLMQLRQSLGELPPDEVSEILKEIRGHILERAEASGELTEERLVAILKALGSPEQIAPLYQADALVTRARGSLSPRVVMRGIHRWSTVSAWGFVLFVVGVVGYATGAALALAGLLKIFAPDRIGAWVGPHNLFDIGVNNDPAARDVLGWWLVPLGLIGGPALVFATTRALRWTLRFARIRRPGGQS
ncbi:MAG: HAAS signaling domain-containing protein [Syntrophomonadaceae bacterium]